MPNGEHVTWAVFWLGIAMVVGVLILPLALYACISTCVNAYYETQIRLAKSMGLQEKSKESESVDTNKWNK